MRATAIDLCAPRAHVYLGRHAEAAGGGRLSKADVPARLCGRMVVLVPSASPIPRAKSGLGLDRKRALVGP